MHIFSVLLHTNNHFEECDIFSELIIKKVCPCNNQNMGNYWLKYVGKI